MYTFKLSDSRFVFSLMNQMAGSMYVVSTATANSTEKKKMCGLAKFKYLSLIPQILTQCLQRGRHCGRHWQISQDVSQDICIYNF